MRNFPFKPLNADEQGLLDVVCDAHLESAKRDNVSTTVIGLVGAGSRNYERAIAAGILSLGGIHAPLELTTQFLSLDAPEAIVSEMISSGQLVPGWGNSFYKDGIDPLWEEVDHELRHWPDFCGKLQRVTVALHDAGRKLYPNASAYTALTALILGVPGKVAGYIFIAARLPEWTRQLAELL